MSTLRIALIQTKYFSSPGKTFCRSISLIEQAVRKKAKIICLQELFYLPYFPQTKHKKYVQYANPVPGPLTQFFSFLAKTFKIVLIIPLFEKDRRKYYNSVVVIDADGKYLGAYRKVHIPNDPGYYEKFYFSPGNLGFKVFKTKYAKISPLICWDQWFPESARAAALKGAQIIFFPTAIGKLKQDSVSEASRDLEAWKTIQRSHAVANSLFVASVNRVGREGNVEFWGHSFVAGPKGELLAQAGKTKEEILIADCHLDDIQKQRKKWLLLEGRRPEVYSKR